MWKKAFILLSLPFALFSLEEEELVWEKTGPSVQEFNSYLQGALADQDWWAVIDYADIISYHFPESPFAPDTPFLMGQAYFNLNQWELANDCFSAYLNHTNSPKHFEEAIEYKFSIAEHYRAGKWKRLFSSHKMPTLVPAKEDAIDIYDEVVTLLPHHDLGAHSLLGKALIQAEFEEYKPSLETLQVLIRRFPKHDLAAEAYLQINRIYLMQCNTQHLDPDLLDLAEVNLRKFRQAFPRENRIQQAEKIFKEMQEVFAKNLYTTGYFFEKTKKLPASKIYYEKVIAKFPNTDAAREAEKKLEHLSSKKQ